MKRNIYLDMLKSHKMYTKYHNMEVEGRPPPNYTERKVGRYYPISSKEMEWLVLFIILIVIWLEISVHVLLLHCSESALDILRHLFHRLEVKLKRVVEAGS